MEKKCIVLGAGFSKASASLPTMNEMFDKFNEVYQDIKSNNPETKTLDIKFGEIIINFLNDLKRNFVQQYLGNKVEIKNNIYAENFEELMTFIDLCLSHGNATTVDGDYTIPSFPTIFTQSNLREVYNDIKHYLYLSLINDNSNEQILDNFLNKLIIEPSSTTVITFNYDLTLEKYLYKKNVWFPNDGYGFVPTNLEQMNNRYQNKKSELKILKLHGSLNWQSYKDEAGIKLDWYNNNSKYFFPNFLAEEKKVLSDGGIRPTLILPSYIKEFECPELINIWNIASNSLRDAEEIIFIGYSLPSADSAVCALLAGINFTDKNVKIINRDNSLTMIRNYNMALRRNNYVFISSNLEEYLNKI